MTKEELWRIYTDKNPQFLDEDAVIQMTGRGLRKLFEQTWDQAHGQGFSNGKAKAEIDRSFKERLNKVFPWMEK